MPTHHLLLKLRCILFALPLLGACSAHAGYDPTAYHAETLLAHGIATNAAGLRLFFEEIAPENDRDNQTTRLLNQLESNEYQKREYAAAALGRTTPFPRDALQKAAGDKDPDLRRRAQSILINRRDELDYLVYAALEFTAHQPVHGLLPQLIKILPACSDFNQQIALRFAIVHSATIEDKAILLDLLQHEDARYRVIAQHSIAHLLPAVEAAPWHTKALQDPSPGMQLEGAARLAEQGNDAGIRRLVQLLDHASVNVRGQAARTLRLLTGQAFAYACHALEPQRETARARWQTWCNNQSGQYSIKASLSEQYLYPRILACNVNDDHVEEIDLTGNVIQQINRYEHPWAVHLLPNGHKLISWRNEGQYLTEHDLAGRVIWRSEKITAQARSIQILPNGNIWMTNSQRSAKTVEINRNTNFMKERPFDPQLGPLKDGALLPNGNSLLVFTDRGIVREIDANGIIRREIKQLKEPYSIQSLPNNHLLIAEGAGQRVIEYDAESNIVWSTPTDGNPRRAQRLKNGNSLISTQENLSEVTPGGDVIWQHKTSGPVRAWRF